MNNEDEINGASFIKAFGFIVFKEQAKKIFSKITDIENLTQYENGKQHVEEVKSSPTIPYSYELEEFIDQLKQFFGDGSIGTFR